ncbi:uncharacterized protein LOC131614050 [Vicia villosa]|uniref:uncharacterized protein LOC131614050 n=1 Tax=Vicia villosa TaxID=3911 RepID=UPI00273B8F71|nr:uncharacterized protein LOC131614050 [Vicia villosa]
MTFIPGRQILDGVLVTNEIIDYAKRNKKECLICKVDFAQAYDCVYWNFVKFMLKSMGFGDRWMKWVDFVVFTSSMAILVNGSPTEEFQVSRGLRQGDPLSPFLFKIVAEGLAGMVRQASLEGCSSLFMQAAASFLGYKVDILPFKFLGFTVGGNQRTLNFWKPVICSLKEKLALWKGKLLSIGGRVTLLNNVLSNIPCYQLSFYKLPLKAEKEIRAIQIKFLWQGVTDKCGVAWVKWDIWVWRFLVEEDSIWNGVMKHRYGELRSRLWNCDAGSYGVKDSLWWRDLIVLCANPHGIIHNIRVKIGNGSVAIFWSSCWLGNACLVVLYPSLYQETTFKEDTMKNMGYWRGESWCWNVIKAEEVLGLEATAELEELQDLLMDNTLNFNCEDVIIWPFDASKCFTVRSCYKLLMQAHGNAELEISSGQGLKAIWEAQPNFDGHKFVVGQNTNQKDDNHMVDDLVVYLEDEKRHDIQ